MRFLAFPALCAVELIGSRSFAHEMFESARGSAGAAAGTLWSLRDLQKA